MVFGICLGWGGCICRSCVAECAGCFQVAFKRCFRGSVLNGVAVLRGFALSLTLSHGRGDWVVALPPLVYFEAIR